jgi:hypothetical protein
MSIAGIFTRRVRGVRLVEVWAIGLLVILVFGVYLTKTFAGREAADIARTQSQIEEEQTRIRLLKAEVAYLEQPERIERLSQAYLHLEPLSGKRETDAENLADIVRRPQRQTAPAAPEPAGPAPMAMTVMAVPAPAAGAAR